MSGHSKWATIKRKKGAIDAKRGVAFTKCAKEITVAAKSGGGDPEGNARLRAAVLAAKAINMPNANIDRAIKRGTGEIEGVSYEEVVYEGYGAGGVAVYVEALTDKRTRTYPEIRKIFEKCAGTLGNNGSVAYLFEKKGITVVSGEGQEEDALMELVLEAGADDLEAQADGAFEITAGPSEHHQVIKALEEAGITTVSAQLSMIPSTTTAVEGKEAEQVLRLVSMLDDHDDVQNVWANFDIDEETMAAFDA
ncbi:MAG: YebC/PmpR family DNA-binding transcriptional regulator [Acidobacteriota bacterium]